MEDDKVPLSVRKGAWTEEEDVLLRRCIEKYGEGKWHQVPFKAGLNRCRKSCRLRWLNYLKPTIKRGEFGDDEVDLIIKLHKLLGNRWSLIAGRLPGRTANDVKNYWNSLLRKKVVAPAYLYKHKHQKVNVIKPRPWSFTKKPSNSKPMDHINLCKAAPPPPPPAQAAVAKESHWWESLLEEKELEEEQGQLLISNGNAISDEKEILSGSDTSAEVATPLIIEDGLSSWSDFVIDMDLWEWDYSHNNNYLNSENITLD